MISLASIERPAPRISQDAVIGGLNLCQDSWRAYWRGVQLDLTSTEFTIVSCLAIRPGIDLTFWRIYQIARGGKSHAAYNGDPHGAVRSYMKRIRAKFHAVDPGFDRIENYPGFGYRWRIGEARP